MAYKVQDAGGRGFVLGAFGKEQEPFTGLGSPSGIRMGHVSLLGTNIAVQGICCERFVGEPEETL